RIYNESPATGEAAGPLTSVVRSENPTEERISACLDSYWTVSGERRFRSGRAPLRPGGCAEDAAMCAKYREGSVRREVLSPPCEHML
ncbi:MAG TPA: hypothetical protein PKA88_23020, partial [Polyangiaceae bacterium]|nr:hypothetical protein [Polyangiaceae bacterium]